MLSPERYNASLKALVKFKEETWQRKKEIVYFTPYDKQIMLDEQCATQQALNKLGLTQSNPPSEIPYINSLITSEYDFPPNAQLVVSIIGMPKSGKSTTLETCYENTQLGENYHIFRETVRKIEADLEAKNKELDYEEIYTQQYKWSKKVWEQIRKGTPTQDVIIERDWTDIAFLRANLLHGRVCPKFYKNAERQFAKNFDKKLPAHLIINCLTPPNIALGRETEIKPYYRVMNWLFLNTLYEQYLRFHYEAINFNKFWGIPRPFTYTCLDSSSEDVGENIRLIEKTINWTLILLSSGRLIKNQKIDFTDSIRKE